MLLVLVYGVWEWEGRGDEEVLVSGVRGWGRPQPQANGDIEEGWMFLTLRTVGEFRVDNFI